MSLRNMILASLFAALLTISSQIFFPLPFSPVPHTLQVIFVMLAGLLLGPRWGTVSVGVWVLLGLFGLPVFAQGKAGAAVLVGPTGGFIVGFAACALFVGWLTEHHQPEFLRTVGSMLAGLVVLYVAGLIGFMASFTFFLHKTITWQQSFALTIAPCFLFDILKKGLAAFMGVKVRRALLQAGLIRS
jgi:biotin transport system substrate-specific component